MTGLYVLSNCLDHILDAVIKLHRIIGVEMRVSILKEFYGDCSLEVEVYPHRELACIIQDTSNLEEGGFIHREV